MYCPKCGTENIEKANYCKNCGNVLNVQVTNIHPEKYAGFWIRTLSAIIDGVVVILLYLVTGFSCSLIMLFFWREIPKSMLELIAYIAALMMGIFYEIWMHVRFGQTVGKMATNIRVVTIENGPITYKLSFLRWLGKIINSLTLGIGYIVVVFNKQKRGLHDLIATTKVVYLNRLKNISR